MIDEIFPNDHVGSFTRRQQLYIRYTFFVLIDLTVLNFFNQYWDLVFIADFSASLLTAVLLQILLQLTIMIEHRVAGFFKTKSGVSARIMRGLSTWAILFFSKLLILKAIDVAFGDDVLFSGPIHGLVAFIAVVIGIVVAEQMMLRIYHALGKKGDAAIA